MAIDGTPLEFTDDQWQRCFAAWHNKAYDLFENQSARTQQILDKGFRGFVEEFVTQANNQLIRQEIIQQGEQATRLEELKAADANKKGDEDGLHFHSIAMLNQLTRDGHSDEAAYQLLKQTIKHAVLIFNKVTNDDNKRDFPYVPRTRVGTPEENDIANKELLFRLLRDPEEQTKRGNSMMYFLRSIHGAGPDAPAKE